MEINYKKQLVIGTGEIGMSLHHVLSEQFVEVDARDKNSLPHEKEQYDVLHICYGYYEEFVKTTKDYISKYKPKLVIIHSTVPVGTTKECGYRCVHSPVRGKHPHLEEGIKLFVKFFAYENEEMGRATHELYNKLGIANVGFKNPKTTELFKILSTTYYGLCIVFQKEAKKLCDEHDVSFTDVYTLGNQTYNSGYYEMGLGKFIRPVLKHMDGKIGGHCVINNCKLLETEITKFILDQNEKY